jgi:poly-gamma-glutamate capsule biosynthesis protein CapA/YwtB (metallophosphatase superfamily)
MQERYCRHGHRPHSALLGSGHEKSRQVDSCRSGLAVTQESPGPCWRPGLSPGMGTFMGRSRGSARLRGMRARWVAGIAVAGVMAMAGCADPGQAVARPTPAAGLHVGTAPTPQSPPATTTSSTPARGATATGPEPTPSDPGRLTLAFAGDVHFEDYLRSVAGDPHGLDLLRSTLGAADLSMVNLETAITQRGTKIGKEFHFRAPASALDTLSSAGIDALAMANNHGVDYGPVGLRDTLAAKHASPIPIVGIGANEDEAFASATLTAKGVRVAVLSASQVYEMTLLNWSADANSPGIASAAPVARLVNAVKKARRTHDVVVVFLHWGLDYQTCPDGQSVSTAAALEKAGADIVVGGHSHRVNGAGWMGDAYVDYGLGNFVWWRSHEPDSRTGVLTLSVDIGRATAAKQIPGPIVRKAVWTPMLIGTDGIPKVASGADATRLLGLWKQASRCTGLAASP